MFFGVTEQEIDQLSRKNRFYKKKSYVCLETFLYFTLNKYFLTQKSVFYHKLFSNNG